MNDHQLSEREVALLVDLGRLLKKHGPDVFSSLATSLAEPNWADQVSTILQTVVASAPKRPVGRGSASSPTTAERVNALLRRAGSAQAELLEPIVQQLVNGELLPRLTDVMEFASTSGLPAPRARSRGEAIVQLVRDMLALAPEEFEKLALEQISTGRDRRSLEGWSRIIQRSRTATTKSEDP